MNKPFPMSFSKLNTFEQCPKKFWHIYVDQTFPQRETEQMARGTRMHSSLEHYGKTGDTAKLTAETKKFKPMMDRVREVPGDKYYEHKMAITIDKTPCDWDDSCLWFRGIADVLIVDGDTAYCLDHKGLAVSTPLPTPTGWTTMGDVQIGDVLFSSSGEQCIVTDKSEVKHIRCFEITFDDTSTIVCDEEHLWKLTTGQVLGVQKLIPRVHRIEVAAAIATENVDLPIDPYVLGLWLADGKHTTGEISKPDSEIWEEVQRRGYKIGTNYSETSGKCRAHTVLNIRGKLAELDVLMNKHIPQAYLRAGYAQRLDLLRGLMDGDGSANPHRKQAIFSTTDERLADGVFELLCTLGQRPLKNYYVGEGFGKLVDVFPISFRPLGINPFLLPRKANRIDPAWGKGNSWRRQVVAVEEVSSVPTQCIAVNSYDRTFLCGKEFIPTHNTGKPKHDSTQLALFALLTFAHFPEVQEVKSSFLWLAYDDLSHTVYQRRFADDLWKGMETRLQYVQDAIEAKNFVCKPTKLCGWCPAQEICPEAYEERSRRKR